MQSTDLGVMQRNRVYTRCKKGREYNLSPRSFGHSSSPNNKMGSFHTFSLTTVVVAVTAVLLYAGYRAILPKPLPGIPYNKDAAGKLFGDVPEMMAYVMRTKRIYVSQVARH
jgi:hypothetical protein